MSRLVQLNLQYYYDPLVGKPVALGSVFIGEPGLDPTVEANRKTVSLIEEDGTVVPILAASQPLSTNAGGGITVNGSSARVFVEGNYSLKVLRADSTLAYFFPNSIDIEFQIKTYDNVAEMIADTGLSAGEIVETAGYVTKGDGGDNRYEIVAASTGTDDGGLFIDLDTLQAKGLFPRGLHFARQWGVVGDQVTDDQPAAQAAIDSGFNIHFNDGDFRVTDELLIITPGQRITGNGAGFIDEDNNVLIGAKTVFFINKDDTIPAYRKTRREAPANSGDPDDADLSVIINNQGENAFFDGFAIELDCDYTDSSPTNLGADCDIGLFNGCRTSAVFGTITVFGYFRVASQYLDVTATGGVLANHTPPEGTEYPETYVNGSDRIRIKAVRTKGGLKGLFLAGAKWTAAGNYFDYISETIVGNDGSRGGSGCSDLYIEENCYFQSREHHSGRRAYDPTMDTSTEDTDAIAAPMAFDGLRESTTEARTRRIHIGNCRLKTGEAARLWLDRVTELDVDWMHTEPNEDITMDTDGNAIDITDYDTISYGPIAGVPTGTSGADPIARDGAREISLYGLWGTGVQEQWMAGVEAFTHTRYNASAFQMKATIADDDFFSFVPPSNFSFGTNMLIGGNLANNIGLVWVRAATASASAALAVGANVDVTTGALNGTTGTNGKLTISVNAGIIYIENRTGAERTVQVTLTNPSN